MYCREPHSLAMGRVGVLGPTGARAEPFLEDQHIADAQSQPAPQIIAQCGARRALGQATTRLAPGVKPDLVVRRTEPGIVQRLENLRPTAETGVILRQVIDLDPGRRLLGTKAFGPAVELVLARDLEREVHGREQRIEAIGPRRVVGRADQPQGVRREVARLIHRHGQHLGIGRVRRRSHGPDAPDPLSAPDADVARREPRHPSRLEKMDEERALALGQGHLWAVVDLEEINAVQGGMGQSRQSRP